jgi:hypothetical protein
MKTLILIPIIFSVSMSYSQSLFISPDTTQLVFPSEVSINLSRSTRGPKTFQILPRDLNILMIEINFLLNRLQLGQDNVVLYRQNEELLKSSVVVMEKKYLTELERTILHKSAFESLEKVSSTYHTELQNCKSDLNELSQTRTRSRRQGFLRGVIWGTVIGGLLGITVDTAIR